MLIGHFMFADTPASDAISLTMLWQIDVPSARISIPRAVRVVARDLGAPLLDEGETLNIASALGFAVTLAGLCDVPVVLAGDKSVWPSSWGALLPDEVSRRSRPALHALS